jgi:membrane-associated phospholipid phosphatase
MLISLINQFTEYVQFIIVFSTLVYLWFDHKSETNNHPYRGRVLLTVGSIVLAHTMVHVFGSLWIHATPPRFFIEQQPLTTQGWEAFYLQWYNTPSSVATWLAFAIGIMTVSRFTGLLLLCFSVLLAWSYIVSGLAYPSDILYAMMIGSLCALALHGLYKHFTRVIEGIEQLCFHIPHIIYPMMLLLMIDLDNDLRFMTAVFHFMFGYTSS